MLNKEARHRKGIKVLTYNFFIRPPPINTDGDDYKNERLNYFTKEYLDKFDIICFQECFNVFSDRKQTLIERANEVGFRYHSTAYLPGYYGSKSWDGGQLTLSRYPILQSDFYTFKYGVLEDVMCAKGVLYNKIDISHAGGKYLHTFNVHTQATYTDRTLQTYVESYVCRHEQVKEVREFVQGKLYSKESQQVDLSEDIVMILGDFNVNAS